ncbi:DUF4058 family protein [Chlorogloeopsis sp. ULAP01]
MRVREFGSSDLQNPIPSFFLPLRKDDTEPLLEIQPLINDCTMKGIII